MRIVSLHLMAVFAFAQLLGLMAGSLFLAQGVSVVENAADPANALYFFGGILFSTAVLLLVLYFYKGELLFRFLDAFLLFATSNILLSSFVQDALALAGSVVAVVARILFPVLRQPLLLFSSVVVGALLGSSLDLFPVTLFALLLVAYDFGAVFWSKHMIVLAKGMEKRKASFTVSITRGKDGVQLGTGDIVIPIVVGVSALKGAGVFAAAFGVAGAVAGFYLLMSMLERKKGYYPGLPPIVLSELAFLGAFFLLRPLLGL